MAYSDQVIGAESAGNRFAKNPYSSATGAGQFIDSTWLNLINKYRPDLASAMGREEILALRTNPDLSRQMVDAYGNENAGMITRAGFQDTPATRYLAHFAGPQGAISVLGDDPATPATSILGGGAAGANPFLSKMTAADLINWAGKKMGGGAASGASSPAPGSPMADGAAQAITRASATNDDGDGMEAVLRRVREMQARMQSEDQQDASPFMATPAFRAQQFRASNPVRRRVR